jgi:hypothetical protein
VATPSTTATTTTTAAATTATTTTTTTTKSTYTGPFTVQTAGAFSYLGCYTDAVNLRTLNSAKSAGNTNTVESCAKACINYPYFGVEYGAECYCDTYIGNGATPATSGCSMTCSGNATECCGGANRLSMYYKPTVAVGHALVQGCWTDSPANRTLTSKTGFSNIMTVEQCATICSAYTYFGVEYAQECYCGNVLAGGSTLADSSGCNMHALFWEYEGDVWGPE